MMSVTKSKFLLEDFEINISLHSKFVDSQLFLCWRRQHVPYYSERGSALALPCVPWGGGCHDYVVVQSPRRSRQISRDLEDLLKCKEGFFIGKSGQVFSSEYLICNLDSSIILAWFQNYMPHRKCMERMGEGVVTPEVSVVFNNAAREYRDNIISQSTGKEINSLVSAIYRNYVCRN